MKISRLLLSLLIIGTTAYASCAGPAEIDPWQGVIFDADGQTAAHLFVLQQPDTEANAVIFEQMLRGNHLLVNAQDNAGQTPLQHAAALGKKNMVLVLLREQALPTLANEFGATAVHRALESDNEEILALILNNYGRLTLTMRDSYGFTPYDKAVLLNCSPEVQQYLLDCAAPRPVLSAEDTMHTDSENSSPEGSPKKTHSPKNSPKAKGKGKARAALAPL